MQVLGWTAYPRMTLEVIHLFQSVGGSSPWTRPSAPGCGDTLKALAGDQRPIYGGDRPRRRLRVAIDWVTGWSYSSARRRLNVQSGQRKGRKELRLPIRALPSVIVVTEKVMREADGPVEMSALTAHFG